MTHIVYRDYYFTKLYFCGIYTDIEIEGEIYADLNEKWSFDQRQATLFTTTDAWDLLGILRKKYRKVEVERIIQPCLS